ncbi:hypothetical protein IUY40_11045 [Flavobacterium sp. ALJ2]|uniref:hypothetical protein n=1 Tax=Flavobacterium sp. ALJ2 TaxID=2786960 RepID=UPI00189F32B6|nr:hypothetical protein [Flavobacterium sp. ALJ2]MBF7092076.1 hypothetical protein [Flavobacterium sp. ALJ2]
MKRKNIIINMIYLLIISSCNSQQKENYLNINSKKDSSNLMIGKDQLKNNQNNMKLNIKEIKEYLDKQERIESDEIEFQNPHILSDKDLQLTFPIVKKALLNNGYHDEFFFGRLNDIFELKENKSMYNFAKYFDVSCLKWDDKDFFNKSFWIDRQQYIVINFENKVITDIFSLKEILEVNHDSLKLIVPQRIISRNMYLFNDSRAHFKWLLLNDKNFMQSLVTTFGYYDDKELLKWVVENTKFDSNNPNQLDKIFWNKKCDGTVKLNLEIFPVLREIIKPEGTNYFEALKMYVMYLLEDKDKRNELSLQDRAKLLAHLVYFGEQYRYDEKYKDKSYFMQRIWMRDIDDSVKKEIIKNNYYNLPNYKKLYEKSEEYQNALADENGG